MANGIYKITEDLPVDIDVEDTGSPHDMDSGEHTCDLPESSYIYSCGRIEAAKGYEQLCDYFLHYRRKNRSSLKLVLTGNANMVIPESDHILYRGFVTDDEKNVLMKNASAVMIPSPLESFSLVALEAWKYGTPVIANGNSPVLHGHVERSNGGWDYVNFEEFEQSMCELEQNRETGVRKGSSGKQYLLSHYSEKKVADLYQNFIHSLLSRETISS